jgi:hypothetical protein
VTAAHIAGVPLEELAPVLTGAGGGLLLVRAWLRAHLRR